MALLLAAASARTAGAAPSMHPGANLTLIGRGACRFTGWRGKNLCGQGRLAGGGNATQAQCLAQCLATEECGAADWQPRQKSGPNWGCCLWKDVPAVPEVYASEGDCGYPPHPAGCGCWVKTPRPPPAPGPWPVPPLQPPPRGGAPCKVDTDCFLAGVCVASKCACDAWATGANCSLLNLAPASPDNGLQLPGYHSWGGHAVKDNSSGVDVFHGYFSFMLGHCTLSSWTTNSALIHGVASSPDGPFTPAGPSVDPNMPGVMVPPWAHSAFITYSEVDKLFLLSHIGPGGVRNHGCNAVGGCWNLTQGCTRRNSGGACTRCDTQGSTPPACWRNCSTSPPGPKVMGWKQSQQDQRGPQPLPVGLACRNAKYTKPTPTEFCTDFYVHTATNVSGPWSEPLELSVDFGEHNNSWYGGGGNNPSMPALYLFPNGTTLLYYQATTCPEGWGNAAPACVGVMRGDTWRGPYHHVRSLPIVHPESEDPFVFRTRRGFHLLTNVNTYHKRCKIGVPCGGHSFRYAKPRMAPLYRSTPHCTAAF